MTFLGRRLRIWGLPSGSFKVEAEDMGLQCDRFRLEAEDIGVVM